MDKPRPSQPASSLRPNQLQHAQRVLVSSSCHAFPVTIVMPSTFRPRRLEQHHHRHLVRSARPRSILIDQHHPPLRPGPLHHAGRNHRQPEGAYRKRRMNES